jgi:hypothetical protein
MSDTAPTSAPPQLTNYSPEGTILDLLVDGENQRPWTMAELGLEIGDAVVVADAVASLAGAGLVHKTSDGFVFATRAAIRCRKLVD